MGRPACSFGRDHQFSPAETQKRIDHQLRLAAVTQQDKGLRTASYFLRALSGEPHPGVGQPVPLSRDAELEKQLTKDFKFQDYLQPQQGHTAGGILFTLPPPSSGSTA